VVDWPGGTRIGAALAEFNRRWARRVLNGRATVLFVTDGLDHEAIDVLETEMQRLQRFAHRLVWLNPRVSPHARGACGRSCRMSMRRLRLTTSTA
jgi:uncharacterized protein with von Willebrand factor type A (vWA) domain